jgi:hypothetical protein
MPGERLGGFTGDTARGGHELVRIGASARWAGQSVLRVQDDQLS